MDDFGLDAVFFGLSKSDCGVEDCQKKKVYFFHGC